jgi:hypothetical protein
VEHQTVFSGHSHGQGHGHGQGQGQGYKHGHGHRHGHEHGHEHLDILILSLSRKVSILFITFFYQPICFVIRFVQRYVLSPTYFVADMFCGRCILSVICFVADMFCCRYVLSPIRLSRYVLSRYILSMYHFKFSTEPQRILIRRSGKTTHAQGKLSLGFLMTFNNKNIFSAVRLNFSF